MIFIKIKEISLQHNVKPPDYVPVGLEELKRSAFSMQTTKWLLTKFGRARTGFASFRLTAKCLLTQFDDFAGQYSLLLTKKAAKFAPIRRNFSRFALNPTGS